MSASYEGRVSELQLVKERISKLEFLLQEAVEALEKVAKETTKGFTHCAVCSYVSEAGHSPNCFVDKALEKIKELMK